MTDSPKLYIAGRMRGLPDLGRSRFRKAAEMANAIGYRVIDPSVLPVNLDDEDYMPICLAMLNAADAVLMLDDWEYSQGAMAEYAFARCQGKQVLTEDIFAERSEDGGKEIDKDDCGTA